MTSRRILEGFVSALVESELSALEKNTLTNQAMKALESNLLFRDNLTSLLSQETNPQELEAYKQAPAEIDAAIRIQKEIIQALSTNLRRPRPGIRPTKVPLPS